MLIGAMNDPNRGVIDEIRAVGELGLDFLDLTLEPPGAASWSVDATAIRDELRSRGLGVVGHTAFYLPLASAFEGVRRAAVGELERCLDVFATVGARWMNIHPDRHAPMHGRPFLIERNIATLREVMALAGARGIGVMIENLPGEFNDAAQLGELLGPLPELGLHLDIGHANLQVVSSTAPQILATWGARLRHVHLHDNKGGWADLHLPLGAGTIDVARALRALRACGYDGTITLEVFSPDRHFLAYSRDVLRRLWAEAGDGAEPGGAVAG